MRILGQEVRGHAAARKPNLLFWPILAFKTNIVKVCPQCTRNRCEFRG